MKISSLYDPAFAPCVRKVRLRTDTDYLTEANENEPSVIRYLIAGTAYGNLHKTNGEIRFWKSKSGAGKVLTKFKKFGVYNGNN